MKKVECKLTVGLFLKKGNQILLMKRQNTGFEDGKYALVSGHVEENESLKAAMLREAREEIGIELDEEDLKLLGVHHRNTGQNYINFFFMCENYKGQEKNCEPDKCSEIRWFDLEQLPENLGETTKGVMQNWKTGEVLYEKDWKEI